MRVTNTQQNHAGSPPPRKLRQVRITLVACLSETGSPGVIAEIRDATTNTWIAASGRKRAGVIDGRSESCRAISEARNICRVFGLEAV